MSHLWPDDTEPITYYEAESRFADAVISGNFVLVRAYARIAESRFRADNFTRIQSSIASGKWPCPGSMRADDDKSWCDGPRSLREGESK